jgi:glycosyltransferase involved in cell wall biosynthesis
VRIAFVITRADAVGGAQVHVRDLAAALLREGHEAKVFVGGTGPVTAAMDAMGVPYQSLRHLVHPIRPWRDWLAVSELAEALGGFRPELVSTHSSKAGLVGRLAARRVGVPALFTAHGWAFTEGVGGLKSRVYRLVERVASRWARRILTVSEYDRDLAIRKGVAPPEKLVAIHNGMPDVPVVLRSDPAKQPPHIVMVARFEKQKDHRTLVLALAGVQDLPWTMELIGGGPLMEGTKRLAVEHGIAGRVNFPGDGTSVAERLAQAQLFVLTSHYEGLPRSIIEAMRAGLPVVASDVGGVAEEVADGETGFVVPRGDVERLRGRLRTLLSDPATRVRMGDNARRRYENSFTLGRMVEETWRVYDEVLGARPSTSRLRRAPDEAGMAGRPR